MPKLQVESLEVTLKQVTYDAKKLKLWPIVPRCACPPVYRVVDDVDKYAAQQKLLLLLHKLLHEKPY